MVSRLKKLFSIITLLAILGSVLVSPFSVKKADAFLGIPDFNITLQDIPRALKWIYDKFGRVYIEQLRKQMIRQFQNDMVNWIQNGGRPRFVENFMRNLGLAHERAAGQALSDLFSAEGVNICSPFRASLQVLIATPPAPEAIDVGVSCTLGQIRGNLDLDNGLRNFGESFAGSITDKESGWRTWFKLHEANNTLPGTYLRSKSFVSSNVAKQVEGNKAEIVASGGFLDQKFCLKAVKMAVVVDNSTEPPNVPKVFTVDLRRNDTALENIEVIRLQEFLNKYMRLGIKEDGIFGPETEKAVKSFQRKLFLEVDGVVGAETRQALDDVSYSLSPASLQEAAKAVSYEYETVDYSGENQGSGISMNDLPQNERCTETRTVTPGSVIGHEITGNLQKTGIDSIINAKELTQFISAVIDAMINRVAREGLSLIKTGRGSWSKPRTSGGTQQDKSRTRTAEDIQGLEGPQAAELLNMVIDFNVNTQKLQNDLGKLIAGENKTESFATRLDLLFTDKVSVYNTTANSWTPRLCAGGFRGFVDGCMYGSGAEKNLNIETNNPGPYLANKIFHQKLKEKWELVSNLFNGVSTETLITGATMNGELAKSSCRVPDVRITLTPEDENHLPFYDGEGTTFQLKDSKVTNYTGELAAAVKINAATLETETGAVAGWETYLPSAIGMANTEISANDNAAAAYDGLITKLKEQKDAIKKDLDYAQDITPKIVLYASILMDYDRAGRSKGLGGENINLVGKFKNYADALNNRYKITPEKAAAVLSSPRWVEARLSVGTVTSEIALDVAKEELLNAQTATRNEWLRIQRIISAAPDANPTIGPTNDPATGDPLTVDPTQKIRAIEKIPIIEAAVQLIEQSLLPAEADSTDKLRDPIEIGLSPSEAVGQAMANLPDGHKYKLSQSIEQLSNELELRDSQISRQKSEAGNVLGKFEGDPIIRAEFGVEGGDSEWERYFKNRYQYAYVAFIYDYYKHYFKCEEGGGTSRVTPGVSGNRSPAPKPLIEYKSSGFSPNSLSISITAGSTVTFKNSSAQSITISSIGDFAPSGWSNISLGISSADNTRDFTFSSADRYRFKTDASNYSLEVSVNR